MGEKFFVRHRSSRVMVDDLDPKRRFDMSIRAKHMKDPPMTSTPNGGSASISLAPATTTTPKWIPSIETVSPGDRLLTVCRHGSWKDGSLDFPSRVVKFIVTLARSIHSMAMYDGSFLLLQEDWDQPVRVSLAVRNELTNWALQSFSNKDPRYVYLSAHAMSRGVNKVAFSFQDKHGRPDLATVWTIDDVPLGPVQRATMEQTNVAAKAICRCDIKDLLSTGHSPGCPEGPR